jgi:phage head maturation protease
VLFQHGPDPSVGNQPLGSIVELGEDERGAHHTVNLIDTAYVRELIPALDAGLYGASFRFRPMKVDVDDNPKSCRENPEGLPECTVLEASVTEFGPVTFPAYASATAGLRTAGITDELALATLADADRLDQLEAWNRAILRPSEGLRDPPPTQPSEPLWGCGERLRRAARVVSPPLGAAPRSRPDSMIFGY